MCVSALFAASNSQRCVKTSSSDAVSVKNKDDTRCDERKV